MTIYLPKGRIIRRTDLPRCRFCGGVPAMVDMYWGDVSRVMYKVSCQLCGDGAQGWRDTEKLAETDWREFAAGKSIATGGASLASAKSRNGEGEAGRHA